MANIAQAINVLQAMILTEDDAIVLTPTYHVFRMYIPFQGATYLPVTAPRNVSAEILTAPTMNAHNTFDAPDTVRPEAFRDIRIDSGSLKLTLPAKSIVMVAMD